MFSLIMRWFDWDDGQAAMPLGRLFEYTEPHLTRQFSENGQPSLDRISRQPCLFMPEGTSGVTSRRSNRARIANREVIFEYTLDPDVPPLQNSLICTSRLALDMPEGFEFSRNHRAIKDVDLYRFLLRNVRPRRQRPTVFRIEEHDQSLPSRKRGGAIHQ
jgi:hypothetical protein